MPQRIEHYAMIGDCETAALVGRDGSIDWLCLPRFDSGACFAALLGGPENGRWLIAPAAPNARVSRRYLRYSLILSTRFDTAEGAVEVVDFMPIRDQHRSLVRLVRGLSGQVAMRTEFVLRFDYGSVVPWVERRRSGLTAIGGPERIVLRTPVRLQGKDFKTLGEFTVGAGETVPFVMSYGSSHRFPPRPLDIEQALEDTEAFWDRWSAQCEPIGEWSEAVTRSLVVLKGLTYAPTGGVIAAPTTSLPERLGGVRNWDYRFCWLRDATFALMALMHGGYHDEARAWRDWLMRAVAGRPDQLQVLYGLAGERRLTEWTVPWLPGYCGAAPVRLGNDAASQLQLDIYGEVIDAMHQAAVYGLPANRHAAAVQRALLDHLATIWNEADDSIWEVRGKPRCFTYSKVMAWVAFDRAVKMAERLGSGRTAAKWAQLRDQIHRQVCKRGFDATLGSFVQSYETKALDASLLLLPLVGFLPPEDPRIVGTVRAIEERLVVDGFVLRYETDENIDGLPPGEGVFLACSFWLADNYVLQGRVAEARALFEQLLALTNDVGLLAEEYDPRERRQLGNFPQAFSHVALVNTAYNLTRAAGPADQRARTGSATAAAQ